MYLTSRLIYFFIRSDRDRQRQEGYCHLRPCPPAEGLPQDPGKVTIQVPDAYYPSSQESRKCALVVFAHRKLTIPLCCFYYNLSRLTRELEKKFSDRHVVFVAQRRIMAKPTRTSRAKQMRPRSRTLTSVHEKLLEDLVYPTEITGKRTRVQTDQKKIIKVYVFFFLLSVWIFSLQFRTDRWLP